MGNKGRTRNRETDTAAGDEVSSRIHRDLIKQLQEKIVLAIVHFTDVCEIVEIDHSSIISSATVAVVDVAASFIDAHANVTPEKFAEVCKDVMENWQHQQKRSKHVPD